ncbi:MAG: class I SAM-dependent methyltransferase [Rhodospirillales bacterium]|nr:class I SAM-dependent methyltransferase [Rhodospirillales bacterium]
MTANSHDKRVHAPATARNRDPILAVLRRIFPESGRVLEVASGSGEHAAYFAPRLPGLTWQPSDPDPAHCASIAAWADHGNAANLRAPMTLDVLANPWPVTQADAVVCINMIHIAPWDCCLGLLDGAARILGPGGVLYLYGPYRIGGRHTAPSNESFDAWLTDQNPSWGVRDLDRVREEADGRGLKLMETVEMPANNLSVIFRKEGKGGSVISV